MANSDQHQTVTPSGFAGAAFTLTIVWVATMRMQDSDGQEAVAYLMFSVRS
jgi:hypothetical protein